MKIELYLLLMCSVLSLNSCSDSSDSIINQSSEYEERISNIHKLLSDYNLDIDNENFNVFIIPVEKCVTCNDKSLSNISEDVSLSNQPSIFILTDSNANVEHIISDSICTGECIIIRDSLEKIPKYGLALMRSIKIVISHDTVSEWKFL